MLVAILALLAAAPQPTPSAPPLKTIEHVYSGPFCTAFRNNVKHSVEGLLMNDALFKRTEPVFLQAAHDMVSGAFMQSSFNSMSPAHMNADNPRVHFDMNRLREYSSSVIHNLKVIDGLLNDAQRFPGSVNNTEMQELLNLRAQLLKIAKAQNDELNILTGTTEQYMMDSLFGADVSLNGVLAASGKAPPSPGLLAGGPIKGKAEGANPELTQNDLFMNSQMGAIYKSFVQTEAAEAELEKAFTPQLMQASQHCGAPQTPAGSQQY